MPPNPLGVSVTTRTAPPTRGITVDTGTWFVAAFTDVGTLGIPTEVTSLSNFEALFGTRTAGNISLWDNMDVFFREGGKRAIISRGATGQAGLDVALATFNVHLGPGQVSAVGYTVDATNLANISLFNHARTFDRIAIGDVLDEVVTPTAQQKAMGTTLNDTEGVGGLFGPHVWVPAPAGVVGGSARRMAIAPVIAALCARVDETGNPNQAAAGRWLPFQYVTDLVWQYSDADRVTLLDLGINTASEVYGVLENYGFQTPVAQSVSTPFWQLNAARMRMTLKARSKAIAEQYMFRPLDGRGVLAGALRADLAGMLLAYYEANGLYGATPAQAFDVQTGVTINTAAVAATGTLKAVCSVVLSMHAKAIQIELVSVPVGGSI
jgi:hypothetical protein